jgi:transcriptional regulator with XRE-family HTH domain
MNDVVRRLHDKEWREVAGAVFLYWKIRAQIRVLRLQRGWSQNEMARRTGFHQSVISRFENIYHPVDMQIRTLQKFAGAFDVTLVVRMEDWGSFLRDIANMSDESLRVRSFDECTEFMEDAAAAK